jgi:hypothetical protein
MLFDITTDEYRAFTASHLIGLLYENKSAYHITYNMHGKDRHCLEIEDGIDGSLEEQVSDFFVDNASQ